MSKNVKKTKEKPSAAVSEETTTLKHLRFVLTPAPNIRSLTSIWEVESNHNKSKLGYIQWFPNWRRYTFWPDTNTIYDAECLKELTTFIEAATLAHKARKSNER